MNDQGMGLQESFRLLQNPSSKRISFLSLVIEINYLELFRQGPKLCLASDRGSAWGEII